MLSSSGFLIRFIDIGLILLLGFLWISDISSFTHIEMPNKTPNQKTTQQQSLTFLRVEVQKKGNFTVRQVDPEEEVCTPMGRKALEACLKSAQDRITSDDGQPVVLIKPAENSAVQHTVDVMDICDRLGIPKNISKSELQL
jgi:biopolymer transport protein ExbD